MPRLKYINKNFSENRMYAIAHANDIIKEYQDQGFVLTLRQLYYQFVARDIIANKQTEYKRLGSIVNDARLAGLIDWSAIEDRTRKLESLPTWSEPSEIVSAVAEQFRIDMWENQPAHVEVWIEKEALAGVFERVCNEHRVAFLACRGYASQSVLWRAGRRLLQKESEGKHTIILHFGDHDPSGIDMTRDIRDRLHIFGSSVQVKRIALNMEQIAEFHPPPNPAKLTDSRSKDYVAKFGSESWELDSLDPTKLAGLVEGELAYVRDGDQWIVDNLREEEQRLNLTNVSGNWDAVVSDYG